MRTARGTALSLTVLVSAACAPTLTHFTSSSVAIYNNDKCTTSQIAGASEVSIHSVRVNASCGGGGACGDDFSWPLEAPSSVCKNHGPYDKSTAKAYVTGWKVSTKNSVGSQIQRFKVWVDSRAPAVVGGALQLPFRVEFIELNSGLPGPVTQDSNDIELTIEIITLAKGSGLALRSWAQTGTAPLGVVTVAHAEPGPSALQFSAVSGFELATSTAVAPGGAALGTNIGHFGIDTDVTPLPAGGFQNDLHCYMESDSPTASTSQLTTCNVAYVALVGSSPNVVRAPVQPVGHFPASLALDNTTTVSLPVGGASGVNGWPSCGLKSFAFSTLPAAVTLANGATFTAASFKQQALGYLLGDCDTQVLTSGQNAQAIVRGWFVWNNASGTPDQNAGVFIPPINPRFEAFSQDFHPPAPAWTGLFELDSVALK